MSVILSIGKPVWKPIMDLQPGQKRFVFAWFSVIFVDFDLDMYHG
jgi:hypothetical protein